jgi:hypothetical protein
MNAWIERLNGTPDCFCPASLIGRLIVLGDSSADCTMLLVKLGRTMPRKSEPAM